MAIFPFMDIEGDKIIVAKYIAFSPKIALFALIFIVSFLMLCYLFLDFIFGFSVNSALKGCKRYEKIKGYEFLQGIFEEVKFKFSCPSAKLYIKDSEEINAFAVGGMSKKAITLTSGLINHYAVNIEDNQQFLSAIRGILGHEMSHLINKDFLPGLLIIINQKVTNFVSGILMLFFRFIIQSASYVHIRNQRMVAIIFTVYNITNWVLTSFNRIVVYRLYEFFRNLFGRAIEYRCDRQSAKAFGGINMAFALSILGKSGYFTLFSTHPATQRRMRKVEVVEEKNAIIRASFVSQISNFASIMILPLICYYAANLSKIDQLIEYYAYYNYPDFYTGFSKLLSLIRN